MVKLYFKNVFEIIENIIIGIGEESYYLSQPWEFCEIHANQTHGQN